MARPWGSCTHVALFAVDAWRSELREASVIAHAHRAAKPKRLSTGCSTPNGRLMTLPLQTVSVDAIPDGWMGLDNGAESTKLIQVNLWLCLFDRAV